MDLKKEYEKLKAKYNDLPDYGKLDDEFELLYIGIFQEISFPLRFIRRRIVDRMHSYSNFIQGMLQPNPSSLVNLQESKFFNNEDKDNMIKILKELMWLGRQSFCLDTEQSEKEDAKFIVDSFEKWNDIKKTLNSYTKSLRDGWKKEIKKEKSGSYIG